MCRCRCGQHLCCGEKNNQTNADDDGDDDDDDDDVDDDDDDGKEEENRITRISLLRMKMKMMRLKMSMMTIDGDAGTNLGGIESGTRGSQGSPAGATFRDQPHLPKKPGKTLRLRACNWSVNHLPGVSAMASPPGSAGFSASSCHPTVASSLQVSRVLKVSHGLLPHRLSMDSMVPNDHPKLIKIDYSSRRF